MNRSTFGSAIGCFLTIIAAIWFSIYELFFQKNYALGLSVIGSTSLIMLVFFLLIWRRGVEAFLSAEWRTEDGKMYLVRTTFIALVILAGIFASIRCVLRALF